MTHTRALTAPANLTPVLHGDCLEIMRAMQPGSVDLVVTDELARLHDRGPGVPAGRVLNN